MLINNNFIFIRSSVGTLFALPWYLTWFGHSLNQYRSVVRLYDYFLASPFLLPIYVTSAIVLFRDDEIFKEDCDMASIHCLLSRVIITGRIYFYFFNSKYLFQLPDDLPFEYLLVNSTKLYKKYPPELIEKDVRKLIIKELVGLEFFLLKIIFYFFLFFFLENNNVKSTMNA